jgi:hypothetical protein
MPIAKFHGEIPDLGGDVGHCSIFIWCFTAFADYAIFNRGASLHLRMQITKEKKKEWHLRSLIPTSPVLVPILQPSLQILSPSHHKPVIKVAASKTVPSTPAPHAQTITSTPLSICYTVKTATRSVARDVGSKRS